MSSFAIARYLNNGELDNTFGENGKMIVSFDENDKVATTIAISIGRNDSITLCGNIGRSTIGIARVTSEGVLDRTFGNEGKIVSHFMEEQSDPIIRSIFFVQDISLLGLRIVVTGEVGRFYNPTFAAIARYNLQGQLDRNFGIDGKTLINFHVNKLQVKAAAYSQRQSKIVLVADSRIRSGTIATLIARLLPNGSLDSSFGTDGRMLALFALEEDRSSIPIDSYDAVIRPNEILIAGSARRQTEILKKLAVVSVNNIGSNTQFGNRGVGLAQFGSGSSLAKSVIIDARGRILAAGESRNGFALARFLRMGRLDNTFGQGGQVTTQFNEGISEINIIKIDSPLQERIVAAGVADGHFALARYLDNGSLDHSFGNGGRTRTVIGLEILFSRVLDIAFDSQNRIVAAGPFISDNIELRRQ